VPWWPDRNFEREHIKPQQDAKYDPDVWEENIAAYLEGLPERTTVTVGQVAREGMNIMDTQKIGRRDQNRITAVMERLGWCRQPKDSKGNIPWGRG
jgi:predicted P-loop ATPase